MLNRIFPRTHRFHCPDEHQLAAYVDQQLIGAERERVESHLVKCNWCLQQVGFLTRQTQVPAAPAPSALVQRAKALQAAADTKALFGWKWVAAAAVIAVVATGLVVWREVRSNTEQSVVVATAPRSPALAIPDKTKSAADNAVRGASPPGSLPLVLYPEPGAVVHSSDFTIRWEPVPNATAYEVRVVTAEGDLVWHKRVQEDSVSPPKWALRSGSKYFVWVRAWLANGKTQQSRAIGFIGG